MAVGHLTYGLSELRCPTSVKYTPDLEDLVWKRNIEYLIKDFFFIGDAWVAQS